jgi:hypothetical protein
MRMRTILLLLSVPVIVTGCASSEPVRGMAPQPDIGRAHAKLGKTFVNFDFVDDRGKAHPLRAELGDFTVLVLTRCDQNTHGPAVDVLKNIVAENRGADNVRVVGIDIHWSPTGCKDHGACHLLEAKRNLGTLCDTTGAIHRAYGDHKEDWLYVIGPDRTIELAAPVSHAAELSRQLKDKVDQLSRERVDAVFEQGDW